MGWSPLSSPALPCSAPSTCSTLPPTCLAISLSPCFFLSLAGECKLRESWAQVCPDHLFMPSAKVSAWPGTSAQPFVQLIASKTQCTCPPHVEFHRLPSVTSQEPSVGLSCLPSLLVGGFSCLLLSPGGPFLKSQVFCHHPFTLSSVP